MDATQIILLTSLFNIIISGLVGGIVIYTLQKKIDATIQKSLFEHQTKFSAIHPKRMETLEILYRKYIVYQTEFKNLILNSVRVDYVDKHGKTQVRKNWGLDEMVKQICRVVSSGMEENDKKFVDFRTYFETNRIFLSPDTCSEIDKIVSRHEGMEWAMQIYLEDIPLEGLQFSRRNIKELFGIAIDSDSEREEYLALVYELTKKLYDEVNTQAEKLEKLYKSVADVQ